VSHLRGTHFQVSGYQNIPAPFYSSTILHNRLFSSFNGSKARLEAQKHHRLTICRFEKNQLTQR